MRDLSEDPTVLAVLTQNGLSVKEASIYVTLLEHGEASPLEISRATSIKRPTTYVILNDLVEKGLVSHVTRGRGVHYRALDPSNLYESQELALRRLKRALPLLASRGKPKSEGSADMRVFEGVAGLRQVMEDTLTSKGEILCWVDVELVTRKIFKSYWTEYLKKRIQKKIRVRAIMAADHVAVSFKKRDREELRESVVIPKDRFPLHGEMNIYNDKIAILSYDDPVGVIIQNRAIADMQRSIFNLSFAQAQF